MPDMLRDRRLSARANAHHIKHTDEFDVLLFQQHAIACGDILQNHPARARYALVKPEILTVGRHGVTAPSATERSYSSGHSELEQQFSTPRNESFGLIVHLVTRLTAACVFHSTANAWVFVSNLG
jgi:hypothetical protein